jgi:peptide deformylase
MEILKFPHPSLFHPGDNVTVFGPELKVLLDGMWETMKAANGLGLAANQVGLRLRMFVMEGPNGRVNVINPEIISKSKLFLRLKEGCLSSPGEFVIVPARPEWVQIKYKDETGMDKVDVFKGFYSVCVNHEMEHLEGKNFMQHRSLPRNTKKKLAAKWGLK